MMMSYLYCGGTESLKKKVSDLLEVRIVNRINLSQGWYLRNPSFSSTSSHELLILADSGDCSFFLFEFSYKLDIDKFVFIATIELNRPVWPILSKHEAVTLILKYSTLITSTQAGLSNMSCVFVHLSI